ncbi:MAG: metallophosphoesterase family protein [Gemmatimonadota bacterium]
MIYLAGDAGDVPREDSPLLQALRRDVEAWSAALPPRVPVVLLFLGDNVYPEGVRPRPSRSFPADSARLAGQVWAGSGPAARTHGTRVVFVPGNHDWGNRGGAEGRARLENEARLLEEMGDDGRITLEPTPGELGPALLDLSPAVRIAFLDTHAWLLEERDAVRAAALAELERLLSDTHAATDAAPLIVAAHHPLVSAGPHGARRGWGPLAWLHRAGAMLQDLNSAPYRELRRSMRDVFRRTGAPLIWAAGHDHVLQVHRSEGTDLPRWSLGSGSGSKVSGVGDADPDDALLWAAGRPGYMRVIFLTDGGARLEVMTRVGKEASFVPTFAVTMR